MSTETKQVPQWIPVSERLPETDKKYGIQVMVFQRFKYSPEDRNSVKRIMIIPFAQGRFWRSYAGNTEADKHHNINDTITHWMPLPKDPKLPKP